MKIHIHNIFAYILTALLMNVCLSSYGKTDNKSFRIINASHGLADNSAQTIHCTYSGRIIITSLGHINIYDGGYFAYIPEKKSQSAYYLQNYFGNYHLYFDNCHHLWLKDKHKVKCVDMMTESYLDDVKPLFLKENVEGNVDDLFVDSEGRVWLSTEGLIVAEARKYQIRINPDKSLQDLEVIEHELYLFYDDGSLEIHKLKDGTLISSSVAYDRECEKIYNKSTVLLRTLNGFFQIRNGSGKSILLFYNIETKSWTELMRQDYSLNNMTIHNEVLYIACAYGYWTYDLKSKQLEHFDEITLNDGRKLITDINTLEFDRQGGMWAGTEKRGVLYSKPRLTPFDTYGWDNPRAIELSALMDKMIDSSDDVYESGVYARFVDSRGWRWKGERTGLSFEKPGDPNTYVVPKTVGLLNNIAHCIIEDNNHNIWIGTSNGIAVIFIKDGKVSHAISFNENDNVPIESFTDGRCYKLPNGNIVMQSIDHVVEFRPKTFITDNDNFILLYPKFVRLMVNGNVVNAGTKVDGEVIINQAVSRTKHIDLEYLSKTINLTFSALNYFRPLQTYYRVRVLGTEDDKWKSYSYFNSDGLVDSKGLLHLPLVGLEPGKYTIEVQVSMFPDKWPTPPLQISVNVHQPWWQTTGLYIMLFLLIVVLSVVNFISYTKNNKLRIKCNLGEFELVKQLNAFLKRSDTYIDEIQVPSRDEIFGGSEEMNALMNEKFIKALIELKPYLEKGDVNHKILKDVSANQGLDILEFYDLVSANINKNPRLYVRALRLRNGAEMLEKSMKNVDDIASDCKFVSTNFFIRCFKARYGYTPDEYRRHLS